MSTSMMLSDLRTEVRRRSDQENSTFVTDPEVNSYINQSYFELYDLLVQKYGDDYFVASPYTFTTDGTSQFYNLPTDFLKLLGVDVQLGTGSDSFVTIKPFNFSARNRFAVPNFQSFYGVTNLRYRLKGSQLWLTPIAAAGQTVQIWYVPKLTTLVNDTDTVDGISGWTEYIIVDAAIKCLEKEESDTSALEARKAALIARIESAAENRDAGSPATVADTQYDDFRYPTGSGSGYGGAF